MRVTVKFNNASAKSWLPGLRSFLPGATVEEWEPGAPQADYAIVWQPPQQLLDEQPALKAVLNTGAGVDFLMKMKVPSGALLVRLEDAGMAVQMAEYVVQAVVRHFRELDIHQQEMAQGIWTYRKPRMRKDFPVGILGLGVLGERVARAIAQLDYPVLGWSRTPRFVDGNPVATPGMQAEVRFKLVP